MIWNKTFIFEGIYHKKTERETNAIPPSKMELKSI